MALDSLSVLCAMYLKCAIICTQMCDRADGPAGWQSTEDAARQPQSPSEDNICPYGARNSLERASCPCVCVCVCLCLMRTTEARSRRRRCCTEELSSRYETDTRHMDMHAHLQTPLIARQWTPTRSSPASWQRQHNFLMLNAKRRTQTG